MPIRKKSKWDVETALSEPGEPGMAAQLYNLGDGSSEMQSVADHDIVVGAQEVLEELQSVLQSRHFRLCKRGKQFLSFLVQETLEGRGAELKERTIGVELFGRTLDYSTGDDPVVRVQAADVRKRLELYQADVGIQRSVRIDLPPGSYVPAFKHITRPPTVQPTGVDDPLNEYAPSVELKQDSAREQGLVPLEVKRDTSSAFAAIGGAVASSRSRRALLVAFCLGLLCLCLTLFRWWHSRSETPLAAFWGPMLRTQKPVVLCLPKPVVYKPSSALVQRYAKEHPGNLHDTPLDENAVLLFQPNALIRWGDLTPRENSGPSIGSVVAAIQLVRTFTEFRKPFVTRFGQEASFAELRESPGVIIGATNTPWMTRFTSGLHFEIQDLSAVVIKEAQGSRTWTAEYDQAGNKVKDYGLITRLTSSKTGEPIVQVAGATDRGTQAAGELVTDEVRLRSVLATLPTGWEAKNVQILVSTEVHEGKPSPPQVVATASW